MRIADKGFIVRGHRSSMGWSKANSRSRTPNPKIFSSQSTPPVDPGSNQIYFRKCRLYSLLRHPAQSLLKSNEQFYTGNTKTGIIIPFRCIKIKLAAESISCVRKNPVAPWPNRLKFAGFELNGCMVIQLLRESTIVNNCVEIST